MASGTDTHNALFQQDSSFHIILSACKEIEPGLRS